MANRYDKFNPETDIAPVARLLHLAFAGTLDGCEKWMLNAGHANLRVMRSERSPSIGESKVPPEACLLRIPMGQYFGGRSVPMSGIAGVAVGPESRGQGLARKLMEECLREIASEGVALSTLYASTQSLYRQVGYEQAGHRFITTIPWAQMQIETRRGEFAPVRAMREDDAPAVRACYARVAPSFDGFLDRGTYIWERLVKMRDDEYKGFVIEGAGGTSGGIDGYVYLLQRRDAANGRQTVAISDIVFANERAGRGLIRFLTDFCTMAESFEITGGPLHPLLSLFSQQRFEAEKKDYWMLRITDVKAALEQRGYSPAVRASICFLVRDGTVPANAGCWKLEVSDGRGVATKSAESPRAIRCDARGLAAIYAGFYTPMQAKMLGWVDGDDESLRAARGVFAGGTPWMAEMF